MTELVTKHLPLVAGAPDGIKKLRALILELAVSGRLLPQDASDEPTDLLIQRIEALKASRIKAGAVKQLKATDQPTEQPTHAIPTSWRFVQLGNVVEIVRGITFPASEKSKVPSPGRIACLRTANVQDQIEWGDLLYIDESFVSREDQFLQPHDIVMSMANSRELVGKVALVGGESLPRSTFGGFLGVLRPYLIEPRFVMALLRTPSARSALIDSASQTTNIANISLGKLRPLVVALPPLAEQHRIVAKVDELMALCDRLEADQADAEAAHAQLVQALLGSLTQATDAADFRASWQRLSEHFHTLFTTEASIDALKQAVLQLAVMGKLVDQDPLEGTGRDMLESALASTPVKTGKQAGGGDASTGDVPYAIPHSWIWARLIDLYESISVGGNQLLSSEIKSDGAHPVIDQGKRFVAGYTDRSELLIRIPGPVIVFGDHTTERKFVDFDFVAGADGIKVLRPKFIVEKFFWWQLVSYQLEHRGYARHFKVLNSRLFALPPLAEQHRIVAKVDELMALCDQIKAQLRQARQQHAQLANVLVEQAVAA